MENVKKVIIIKRVSFSHPLTTKIFFVPKGIEHRYFCVQEVKILPAVTRKRTAEMDPFGKSVSKIAREEWNGKSLLKEGQEEPGIKISSTHKSTLPFHMPKKIFEISFGQVTTSMQQPMYKTFPNIVKIVMDIWKGTVNFRVEEHFKAGQRFLESDNVFDQPEISLDNGMYSVSLFVTADDETVRFTNLPWHKSGWYSINIPAHMYIRDNCRIDAKIEFEHLDKLDAVNPA